MIVEGLYETSICFNMCAKRSTTCRSSLACNFSQDFIFSFIVSRRSWNSRSFVFLSLTEAAMLVYVFSISIACTFIFFASSSANSKLANVILDVLHVAADFNQSCSFDDTCSRKVFGCTASVLSFALSGLFLGAACTCVIEQSKIDWKILFPQNLYPH